MTQALRLPSSVEEYAFLIRGQGHYAQANYGDGEWACMLGHSGENCNREVYNPYLASLLRETLLRPAGQWCGSNPGKRLKADADAWTQRCRIDVPWADKEILVRANVEGRLGPWLEAVRTRRVVLVGPAHLAKLDAAVIGAFNFIGVAPRTAWEGWKRTCEDVKAGLRRGADLVLFAAGMATNIMVHELWPQCVDSGAITLHDVGALLDPYVGVWSRNPYRVAEWQRDILPRNLA